LTKITDRGFYRRDGLTLAKDLIGKTLVHCVNGIELCGIIAETEAYMGVTDRASHAFGGRRTKRTETMYLEGGYAYVYLIYGMYSCMNITAGETDNPEAVLIRAVYPTCGIYSIVENVRRKGRRKTLKQTSEISSRDLYSFTNGPGKLCNAFDLGREHDGCDMLSDSLFIRDDGWRARDILTAPRVGIDYAGEAAEYPWRYMASCLNGVPIFERN